MKFQRYLPSPHLQAAVKFFAIAENETSSAYKVLPTLGLVAGLQYRGRLSSIKNDQSTALSAAGITGVSDHFNVFENTADTGTLLIYFTETGFSRICRLPAHELFNQSISLDEVFESKGVEEIRERLSIALSDRDRVTIVEKFLSAKLHHTTHVDRAEQMISIISDHKGVIRMRELQKMMAMSPSVSEKLFRNTVGTSPKKWASLVRFHGIMDAMKTGESSACLCYENHYFDQSHFIKDFKKYTGDTPEIFRKSVGTP
jgi:AraC-like DNA-binding protein